MGIGRWLWGAGLFVGACAVAVAVTNHPEVAEADQDLFDVINAGHGPQADRVFVTVTELGSLYASGAAAASLFVTGRRGTAVRAFSATFATWLLLQGMKKVVDRPRPLDANPDGTRQLVARPNGMSWPSSHPAVLTTFTRVAARDLELGAAGRGALTVLDATVATSRVYLGVHYPSDVLSGLLVGRAVARLWPRRRS
ncbi:MAG TPA: phosphatase PAP2 family protein [Actinomycetota bacterium]|nr:phosphatase PAP2 family protein [Actinomycetota bacterium]